MFLRTEVPPVPTFIKAGIATFQKGQQHFQRTFHLFDFIFVTKGTLYIGENGKQFALQAGDYLFLRPGFPHGGYQPCEEETVYYWAHFQFHHQTEVSDLEEVDWSSILQQHNTFTTPDIFALTLKQQAGFRQPSQAAAMFQALLQPNTSNDPAEKMRQQLYFFDFLIYLQKETLQVPTSAQEVARRATAYIHNFPLDRPFLVRTMAETLLYHPDYLTRAMKRVTGFTPNQYMTRHRLQLAKERLQEGEHHLQAIAQECGFSDVSYFSRIFKKTEGMTPGAYRRMSRKNALH